MKDLEEDRKKPQQRTIKISTKDNSKNYNNNNK